MSLLERVFYFHREIQRGNYPNSRDIVEQFEVSLPTAKRDVSYLRDRLLAPITFDPQKNGYFYEEGDFRLPFEESPRIVFLLAVLGKLAGEAGLGGLAEVHKLKKRLSGMISGDYGKIITALQVQWIEVEEIEQIIFETIIEAIVKDRMVDLHYKSLDGSSSQRSVAPLQILNYQGRWYLYAYCSLRQEDRLFHMGRVITAEISEEAPPTHINFEQNQLEHSFGIFQGKPRYNAEILFTSTAAELVGNQYWHADQKIRRVKNGIILELPVSDDREILMKILQYGGMAKVLSPVELADRVKTELLAMVDNYRDTEIVG